MRKVKRVPGAVSKKLSKTKRDDERFRRNGLVCVAILSGLTEQAYAAQPGTQLLGFDLATLQARGIDPASLVISVALRVSPKACALSG